MNTEFTKTELSHYVEVTDLPAHFVTPMAPAQETENVYGELPPGTPLPDHVAAVTPVHVPDAAVVSVVEAIVPAELSVDAASEEVAVAEQIPDTDKAMIQTHFVATGRQLGKAKIAREAMNSAQQEAAKTVFAGTGIADAAKRALKHGHSKAVPSPLLNTLIKRVVKEQDAKAEEMRWEHLVNMHNQIGQYLMNLTTIAAFMRNKVLLAAVQDTDTLLRLVKALAKDMQEIQKRTAAVGEQYTIKSGAITNDDDMLKAFGIYEEYNQILLDIVHVVMPASNQVMEMFTVAERIIVAKEAEIIAAQQAAALTDPTVISDVVAKEIAPATEAAAPDEPAPQTDATADTTEQK